MCRYNVIWLSQGFTCVNVCSLNCLDLFLKIKSVRLVLCVCVCVFGIHMLKIAVERWFWEIYMVFGLLVELHVGLHSCLCFSPLEKLLLKASSTPPRYLAICQTSKAFSYRNLDNFSTPGGLIEKVPASSIASRQLVNQSSFCSCIWWFVPRHLLDTCICRRPFFSIPSSTDVSTPSSIEIYWGSI